MSVDVQSRRRGESRPSLKPDRSGPRSVLPTRSRSWGRVAAAVGVLAVSALIGALVFSRAGDTKPVLAFSGEVTAGHKIERSDLKEVRVSGVAGTIAAAKADDVVGKTASTDVSGGQIVTDKTFTGTAVPGAKETMLGLSLKPAQMPDGIGEGDRVKLIAVPSDDNAAASALKSPPVLADTANVYSVRGSSTDGGTQRVTVVVGSEGADKIASYAAAGRVAVLKISAAAGGQ